MSNNFKVKHGLEVADGITVNAGGLNIIGGGLTLPSELRIGTAADAMRFPNTVVAISNTSISTKPSELHNIGLLAEGTANSTDTSVYGIGVYGIGYTAGATRSGGVVGEGHVSDTADTGSSIGVRGYALDTHIGGANIGLYGNAANGLTNYALYMSAGDINSATAQTWALGGDLTFAGAHTVTIPTLGLTNALPVTSGGTGVTNSTGSGSVVLSDNATLVTPVLGNATVTTINKITLTQPANGSTITVADGKVLTASNSLTFTGTDLSSVAFGAGGTVIYTTNKLSDLATTTSAELAGVISDETGTGALVFANTPALTSPAVATSMTTASTSFDLLNTAATTVNFAGAATALSLGSSTGTTSINNNLQVAGNITFNNGATQISSTVLSIDDPLIYLGDNNAADLLDLGFIGAYNPGVHTHTGLVRDATDKVWKLFSGVTAEPVGNVMDFTNAVYDDLTIGGLTATTGEFSSTVTGTRLISTVSNGTAPFTVTSTTPVANLSIGGNAATVTTNANLTGVITSVGNATSVASQTGTGSKFVMDTSPVLISPTLGNAVATTVNKLTLTQPATSAVLTLDNGSSLITSGAHSITLTSTADSVITLPTSGTLVSSTVSTLSSLSSVGTITTGTWSGSFGAVSAANLTNLTAGNLSGTIPSTVLANSSIYIGSTQIALNRSTGSLVLAGVSVDGSAGSLATTGSPVVVSSSGAPTAGQVLKATSPTTATWQDLPASGGNGTVTEVSSLSIGMTGTDISSTVSNSTTTPVITLNIPTASASNRGALSSTDWSTFNGKAGLASPTFTGTPAGPTATADTNTTQLATTAFVVGQASATTPAMNGTAAIGTSLKYARADHVHASDTTRAPLASPTFTGTPAAPTASAGDNSTQIATTAYVQANAAVKATVNTVTNTISDGIGNLRSVPQNNKTAAYTLVAADNGKNINITTGGVTIPASIFAAGDIVSIYNQSDVTQTITCSAVTVYVAGSTGAKTTLTLAARGILTILFVTATEVIASGNV